MKTELIENLAEHHLVQLHELYQHVWFTQGRALSDVKKLIANSYLTLAIISDDELIAFSRSISDGIYKAFIFDVIVKEEYRHSGFGKKIVDSILEHPKIKNIQHIELYCPEKLIPYYERFGFELRTSVLMRYKK